MENYLENYFEAILLIILIGQDFVFLRPRGIVESRPGSHISRGKHVFALLICVVILASVYELTTTVKRSWIDFLELIFGNFVLNYLFRPDVFEELSLFRFSTRLNIRDCNCCYCTVPAFLLLVNSTVGVDYQNCEISVNFKFGVLANGSPF